MTVADIVKGFTRKKIACVYDFCSRYNELSFIFFSEVAAFQTEICGTLVCPPYSECQSGGICVCTNCSHNGIKVCGSDGNTYNDFCMLQKIACESNSTLKMASEGPCQGKFLSAWQYISKLNAMMEEWSNKVSPELLSVFQFSQYVSWKVPCCVIVVFNKLGIVLYNVLSITGTITTYIFFLYFIVLFFFFFLIFATTDIKHYKPCNYSNSLVLTILSSFFCLFKFNLFFAVFFFSYVLSKIKMVVVVY